jgi:hypothetical protein
VIDRRGADTVPMNSKLVDHQLLGDLGPASVGLLEPGRCLEGHSATVSVSAAVHAGGSVPLPPRSVSR